MQGAKGGALLNLVRANESREGDAKSAKLHAYLLQRVRTPHHTNPLPPLPPSLIPPSPLCPQASEPYMVMLEKWIYRGRLDDPYHEFMVRQEQSLHKEVVEQDFNAAYWDARCLHAHSHIEGQRIYMQKLRSQLSLACRSEYVHE